MTIAHRLAHILAAFVILGVFPTAFAQEAVDRILPASFAQAIQYEWSQDGEAVEIAITNPKDRWVVTTLQIEVHFPVPPDEPFQPVTNGSIISGKRIIDFQPSPTPQPLPEQYVLKLELQPGRTAHTNIELKNKSKIAKLTVVRARGRAQTQLERLRNA